MPLPQKKSQSQIPFIDYKPAQLKETKGDNWRIVFYVKVPGTNNMKRFRRRVKPLANKKLRKQYAQRICLNINEKLASGWSPFNGEYGKNDYTMLSAAMEAYIEQNENLLATGQLRKASVSSYKSMIEKLKDYLKEIGKEDMFCVEYNRAFVTNYADFIHFKKKRSAVTVNNYMRWCVAFGNYMVERGLLENNSAAGIPMFKIQKKKRELIDSLSRKRIFSYYKKENRHYLVLCLLVYFCFLRRTELTKLKVEHVRLADGIIFIPGEVSKNKKDDTVTIPKKLGAYLAQHLTTANQSDYLFSNNNYKAGPEQIYHPKKVSDTWSKMRKELKLKNTYQLYSLKDTGITELFELNVPMIKIRDQARHHDIKITESYTPRSYEKDELLSTMDFDF